MTISIFHVNHIHSQETTSQPSLSPKSSIKVNTRDSHRVQHAHPKQRRGHLDLNNKSIVIVYRASLRIDNKTSLPPQLQLGHQPRHEVITSYAVQRARSPPARNNISPRSSIPLLKANCCCVGKLSRSYQSTHLLTGTNGLSRCGPQHHKSCDRPGGRPRHEVHKTS